MTKLVRMVDQMPINVLMCDPVDFKINYINKTSVDTLRGLSQLLPVPADQLIGQSSDIFHKKPEHQRSILRDPANLPHRAKIQLGDEGLDLGVSPITGASDAYLGPMLCRTVITAQVKLADDFDANVGGVVEAVAGGATEMQAAAETLASTAEGTSRQSQAALPFPHRPFPQPPTPTTAHSHNRPLPQPRVRAGWLSGNSSDNQSVRATPVEGNPMNDDRTVSGNHTEPARPNGGPATARPVGIQRHPRPIQGLARSLTRDQNTLGLMRRNAIDLVETAIEGLGAVDRSLMLPAANQLLVELKGALDNLNSLDFEAPPRPAKIYAIAERLRSLNAKLPASPSSMADRGRAAARAGAVSDGEFGSPAGIAATRRTT